MTIIARFWNFIKNEATETIPENIELRIEGNIVDDDDSWLYEWFGIPCANPNAFRNELNQYSGKDIVVWIDSYGGSVFAATGIYNALMEHKSTGAKVTTKIDSKAMSAATIPFMAGDDRLISPGGVFMMHNPLTNVQGYASDLRKMADVLDVVKETIINAYQSNTGISEEKISAMMDNETYMSAKTAIKEGFATGMLYENASSQEEITVLNFAFNRNAILNSANDSFKHLIEFKNKNNYKFEEEKDVDIKNGAELKTQLPEIHKEIYNSGSIDGIKAERERLKAFDVLNGKVDPVFLNEEKYKDGATAEGVLFKAMQEGKLINNSYIEQTTIDAENANKVPGAISDNEKTDEVTGILNFVENAAKKTLGNGGN